MDERFPIGFLVFLQNNFLMFFQIGFGLWYFYMQLVSPWRKLSKAGFFGQMTAMIAMPAMTTIAAEAMRQCKCHENGGHLLVVRGLQCHSVTWRWHIVSIRNIEKPCLWMSWGLDSQIMQYVNTDL